MYLYDDDLLICVSCGQWIANADLTSLDYHYEQAEAEAEYRRITTADDDMSDDLYWVMGDSDDDHEFSTQPCNRCADPLAGYRYAAALLTSEDPNQ